MPDPSIYLGIDGGYHDDTPENREQFPAAEDQVEENPAPADTPDQDSAQTPAAGTVAPAGDQAGSGAPSPSEPAAAPAPAPKSSTK